MKIIRSKTYEEAEVRFESLPLVLKRLAAVGLSRMWQQMLKNSFGIVSAYKGVDTFSPEGKAKNQQRDEQLRDLLRHFDVGFVQMDGFWTDEAIQKVTGEKSLFIAGADESTIKAVAELYDQDSYVYGNNGEFVIRPTKGGPDYMSGRVADYIRQVNPSDQVPANYSETKGRKWTFDQSKGEAAQKMRDQIEQTKRQFPGANSQEVLAYLLSGGDRLNKTSGTLTYIEPRSETGFYVLERHVSWAIPQSGTGQCGPGRSLRAYFPLREVS